MNSIEFSSLLCSRLCHDLVGPVGAMSNGVELLAEETDPEMRERCLELLADSARQTANKLKFFRLAFGAAGGFAEAVSTSEARTALEGLFGEGKVAVDWMVASPSLPKVAVKLLLNLAMTAGDALLRGGRLNVAAEHRGPLIELAVRAEGPRLHLDTEVRAALDGRTAPEALTPRASAGHLIHMLATEADAPLMVSEPEPGVLLLGLAMQAA